MTQRIIRNARIVTIDQEFIGSVVIEDGVISAVDPGQISVAAGEDWAGDWLLPGLVELHTDNLEKHLSPPPWGVMERPLGHGRP